VLMWISCELNDADYAKKGVYRRDEGAAAPPCEWDRLDPWSRCCRRWLHRDTAGSHYQNHA